MVDGAAGLIALDPGLGADLLAAIAEGNAQRAAVAMRIGDLRDISGVGDLLSAKRSRAAILDCAAGAAETIDTLGFAWSAVQSAVTESAWRTLAGDPDRWRGEFVVERIERPVQADPLRELNSTPTPRFYSFSWPEMVGPGRRFHIPGESTVSLTFETIHRALDGVNPATVLECAARWRYLALTLDSSVDSVDDLIQARCGDDAAVAATGIADVVDSSRRVAACWSTIGNAVRGFGLGLRHAVESIGALRTEHDDVMSKFDGHFFELAQRPVVVEQFERRARTVLDETYGAGLFALVAGIALAGDPA